ncbi:MAG: zinc ribbon domain-containing protein [Halobacteriales archaeon]
MSKITFRADEELVERVERLDESKSEVMREALRAYLDDRAAARGPSVRADRRPASQSPLDDLLAERVDVLLADRVDDLVANRLDAGGGQDIDLTVSLAGATDAATDAPARAPSPPTTEERADAPVDPGGPVDTDGDRTCSRCGAPLSADHVYCPNCGEKATRRAFCDCGEELQSDWAFCPNCGRRTPAAEVLDGPGDRRV